MIKILYIILLFFISCANPAKVNPTIKNKIYQTAIRFSNEKTWVYDASYYKIGYPNGDVPSGGACTDVIIRVLRANNIDLQQLIHEDISANFSAYPNKWGLSAPDPNIDHRRVPNIMKYFERKHYNLSITHNVKDYQPGDIVCWALTPTTTHIGICLENGDIYHNMGPMARVDRNFLFDHQLIGHYRL